MIYLNLKNSIRVCAHCKYIFWINKKGCPKCDFGADYGAFAIYDSWRTIFVSFVMQCFRKLGR
ncbi:hypothetical protein M0R19_06175 [Candidatus Pacearchaeota archaeon]|jgi:hypothetical protein|nr:hypothetical protein [Candidatus Pacearchaeota archaeon]